MSIKSSIQNLSKKGITLFTTPSHSQKACWESIIPNDYYTYDISEVEGSDNLNSPTGYIYNAILRLSQIYSSEITYPLLNGSSQGITALMLATLKENDKIMLPRNSHKSFYSGLILTGAIPVWLLPEYESEFGVYKPLTFEEIAKRIEEESDIKVLGVTTPTYEGFESDIEKIAELCKEKKIILIVDEAHGALKNFNDEQKKSAIKLGADASVNSLHKSAGAINPGAVLHLSKGTKIIKEKVISAIGMLSTSSPSYPLLTNIEECVFYLNSSKGRHNLSKLILSIKNLRKEISKLDNYEICKTDDILRLVIKHKHYSAKEFYEIIYDEFNIECELLLENSLCFLFGIGTTQKKINYLLKVIKKINKRRNIKKVYNNKRINCNMSHVILPEVKMQPKSAYEADFEVINIKESTNRISAEIITEDTPEIPIIGYGEAISEEVIKNIEASRNIRVVKEL